VLKHPVCQGKYWGLKVKNVVIISNNSGGGHRQTARILAQRLGDEGWNPNIVSIYQDIFPDYFRFFGFEGEKFYNKLILTKGMTQLIYRLFFMCAYYLLILPNQQKFAARLAEVWQQKQPDLVISVIPLLNQVIASSLKQITLQIPFVIVQTDLFEFHEPFWLTPTGSWFVSDNRTYTIVGTEEAYQQVLSLFVSDKCRVFKLPGTIIDPCFLNKPDFDKEAERKRVGLEAGQPVGLLLYGGFAPDRLLGTAKVLNRLENKVQFIFICGQNEKLKHHLSGLDTRYNKVVVGYTSQVPYYMHLSDFLIGKPGPGTIMEGIATGLPLLLDTRKVIVHEAPNIKWVERYGFGLQFNTPAQLLSQIEKLTLSEVYHPLKRRVSAYENRAVLEIPAIIDKITAHFERSNPVASRPATVSTRPCN